MNKQKKILITDIDNTLFDWVKYYTSSISALFQFVNSVTQIPITTLQDEAKKIFHHYKSIEHPFLVQEMPSVLQFYNNDIDLMLKELVHPARDVFLDKAENNLICYPTVIDTFIELKKIRPNLKIIALTDAPRYVAMWKLNKLKILEYFDAIYGLSDPQLPICPIQKRVKVDPKILIKHLRPNNFGYKGAIRTLPEEYEKPGTRGFKTILMDYNFDSKEQSKEVLWVGDNYKKDVELGRKLNIPTAWASYGVSTNRDDMDILAKISTTETIAKNSSTQAEIIKVDDNGPRELQQFSDILELL